MTKRMQDYKVKSEPLFKTPKSVQQLIPVCRIAEDGIFQLEDKPEGVNKLFDKAYLLCDTNFATMDEFEQKAFIKDYYRPVLNSINTSFKIIVMNNDRNMAKVREELFIRKKDSRFSDMIDAFNRHLEDTLLTGRSGIDQVKVMVITCEREDAFQAREYFKSVENTVNTNLNAFGSGLIPLSASERLRLLHAFYRMGRETEFSFDFDTAVRRRADWRDLIAPMTIEHARDEYGNLDGKSLKIDGRFVRALYVPTLPNEVQTETIQQLTDGSSHVILTLDVTPIPQEVSRKRLDNLYLQNARAIEKQQEIRNRAGAWSSDISYDKRREKEDLETYMDILNDDNEKMFYVGIYAVITAGSRTELESAAVAFDSHAGGLGLKFEPAYLEQIEAVSTALPLGVRYCNRMLPMFTRPLAGLTPFVVHELYHPGGIFYGVNQVSRNILVDSRKNLQNGNGFVLGITGGGKSMDAKQEMTQVLLRTEDDVILIDPQNEYRDIAAYFGGQWIDFGSGSGFHVNPLDTDTLEYMENPQIFLRDKTELMCSIFSQITDGDITAQDKSLIGRCVSIVYEDILSGRTKKPPTLKDYYEVLGRQPEPQAYEIELALELFVHGALNMFAEQTNVDMKNRFVIFGIAGLGNEQSGIGMTVLLESIRARIAKNSRKGIATWLYIDEAHNLMQQEYSCRYLEKIWKEVRKLGGLCTAITQNLADVLASKRTETMLCNSEYVSFLKQGDQEVAMLGEMLDISDNLLKFLQNAPTGCGLLKFGDKYIPKDNRLPKDSLMYRLFNTNFHEIQKLKKKELRELNESVASMPEDTARVIKEEPTEAERAYPADEA